MPLENPLDKQLKRTAEELKVLVKLVTLKLESKITASPPRSVFCSEAIPSIPFESYLQNCVLQLNLEEWHLIFLIIFLNRYCTYTGNSLTPFNIHRLAINALYLAEQFQEDAPCSPYLYARFEGITPNEIEHTMAQLLADLEWKLFVSVKDYLETKKDLSCFAKEHKQTLGIKRHLFYFKTDENTFLQELIAQSRHDETANPISVTNKILDLPKPNLPERTPPPLQRSIRFYSAYTFAMERDIPRVSNLTTNP